MSQFFFRITLFILLNSCSFALISAEKICLNMIVKNESAVIERCLTSVLPLINYWVIVDTGSTDGTQKIIQDFMSKHGVKGELHERPWINFGHNRNEALELAKKQSDYILFIDADEYYVYEPDFKLPQLDKDYYYIGISHSGSKYHRLLLIKNRPDWKWVGVVHEVLVPTYDMTHDTLEKVTNIYTTEGARSKDPQKYLKDAQLLEAALLDEPENTRTVFYLAQSYRDAGLYDKAIENYEKRAQMGGWDQEVYWSLFQIAIMSEIQEKPQNTILQNYIRANQYRPSRVEPLYHMARYFRQKENYTAGYLAAKNAVNLPRSKDNLFVEEWIYDYGALLELSVCAYWVGQKDECRKISEDLLKQTNLPTDIRALIEGNLAFSIK